jgi:hypothetical protein
MENPATWSEDTKAISRVIDEYYAHPEVIGSSLARQIEIAFIEPLRRELNELKSQAVSIGPETPGLTIISVMSKEEAEEWKRQLGLEGK